MRRQLTALAAAGAVAATGVAGGLAAGAAFLPARAAQTQSEGGESRSFAAERVDRIRQVLAGLVGDGTITEEQADAVAEVLAGSEAVGRHGGPHHGHRGDGARVGLEIPEAELREAVRDGRTLAELAEEQGVSVSAVIESLVSAGQQRLDEAVEGGRLSAEHAEELAAELEEHVTRLVEEGIPMRPGGH